MEDTDILFVTETWTRTDPHERWTVVSCLHQKDRERERGPTFGWVIMIIQPNLPFRLIKRYEPRHVQAIHGRVLSDPVLGCYISPQIPVDVFKAFLQQATSGWEALVFAWGTWTAAMLARTSRTTEGDQSSRTCQQLMGLQPNRQPLPHASTTQDGPGCASAETGKKWHPS